MTHKTHVRRLLPALLAIACTSHAETTENPDQLEEITVKATTTRNKASDYYQKDAGGATRTDTPLQETSQSVKIISRQVLDDIHATRLDDTFDLVSGVSRQNNYGGLWDNFAIRGFAGHDNTGPAMLRNGFSGNRGVNPPRDTANTERVEFLKGPAAALYGNSEPGGTLNVVTKKPQFKSSNVAEVYAGSYDTYLTSIDSTGALSENLAYRMIVAAEDKGSFRDYVDSERLLIAPSFTWLLGPSTTLNYELEYLKHRTPIDRGIALRDSNGNRLPHIKLSRFLGEPNAGDVTMEAYTHQLSLEHEFSERWRGRIGIAYKDNKTEGNTVEQLTGINRVTPGGTVSRRQRGRDFDSDDLSLQAELNGKFETGSINHDFLVGIEAYRFNNHQIQLTSAAVAPINLYAPVYGQQALPHLTTLSDFKEKQTDIALFVQDQLSLTEKWKLMGGLRFESYRQELHTRHNSPGTEAKQDHFVVSPRAGITYVASPQVSLYGSFSRSFRPNSGAAGGSQYGLDATGKGFNPERSRAFELGLKYQSLNQRLGGNIALFDITKHNVLTADPADPGFSIAAGEVRSRGLELDLSGQLTECLRLIASYAYVDAYLGKDLQAASSIVEAGSRLMNIPKHSANTLLMHEQPLTNGGKLGLGGGFSYVGKRTDGPEALFDLPSYVTVRLMTYWQIDEKLRLSFDVTNLFDREYYTSSYTNTWAMPGTPRMMTLGLQAKF
ncbi:TonB-dependent receptor [Methylobacillus arboreus]|uniref:TonB-dependent siderophore receptor n=1 Tax=Methylobacillus arboreus TaxID=755170 RepID=UPI001E5B599A|nr:TonB-dependent receptor [Methylobacillus arboreus]MCB5190596.1 TonB-dependent receptor [Methylobacillus arboreus]